MFDTSLVRPRAAAAPRRAGLFVVSVALHSAIGIAAIATSIATVEFPHQAPRQLAILRPVASVVLPPALGPKRDVAKPKQVSSPVPKRAEPPREVTAPPAVPDEVLPVAEPAGPADTGNIEPGTGEPRGDENGGGGGDPLGKEGGIGDGPPGEGGPLNPGGEVRAARVVRRVEPRYPTTMLPGRFAAVVTVRCIIDRNGRIRDPEIIQSSWAPFNQAVLDAVRQWTFAPGTMRGQPVDTWFELTVKFQVR